MTKKEAPHAAAKKADAIIRHGKNLSTLLTVYARILNGEIASTPEGLESLKLSINCKTAEIMHAVSSGVQQ